MQSLFVILVIIIYFNGLIFSHSTYTAVCRCDRVSVVSCLFLSSVLLVVSWLALLFLQLGRATTRSRPPRAHGDQFFSGRGMNGDTRIQIGLGGAHFHGDTKTL